MSKFLAQSKSFLPMIIQKSSTVKIIPVLADSNAIFVAKQQPNFDVESKPENPSVNSADGQHKKTGENHSVLLADNHHKGAAENPNIALTGGQSRLNDFPLQELQDCKSASVQKATNVLEFGSISISQHKNDKTTVVIISPKDRTLFTALQMDMALAQYWIARELAKGHRWLFRQQLELIRALQVKAREARHRRGLSGSANPREKEPAPVILPEKFKQKQTAKAKDEFGKRESSFRSNLLDAIQDKMPEWQEAISNGLGALQKAVVQKLAKK